MGVLVKYNNHDTHLNHTIVPMYVDSLLECMLIFQYMPPSIEIDPTLFHHHTLKRRKSISALAIGTVLLVLVVAAVVALFVVYHHSVEQTLHDTLSPRQPTLSYQHYNQAASAADAQTSNLPLATVTSSSTATSTVVSADPQQITIVQQPVIEHVIEKTTPQQLVGFVSSANLSDALSNLRNELLARIGNLTNPTQAVSQSVAAGGNAVTLNYASPAAQRIDNLSNTTISNPTITGGSISATSITGTISNVITTALAAIDNLTATNLTATNATTTNFAAINASITNATTTNLNVIGTSTSTFTGGVSASFFNGSATSSLYGVKLPNLDCSGYANGGKLTTDAFGNVFCGADASGGGGSTVAGTNGQVQFNNYGLLGSSVAFTFSTSTNTLATGNASTTNVSASGVGYFATASTTNLTVSAAPSGFLQTNASGIVSATSSFDANSIFGVLAAPNGGTGINSPSTAGVLLGNYSGTGYQQLATSSLGLLTTSVAEGSNLYFTNNRVASVIAGTTTDALMQGSVNRYYSTSFFAADFAATSTSALTEGTNKYYTDARVASYINSSSTVPHIGGSVYGDILYWTGNSWGHMATSTLGIASGGGSPSWGTITGTLSNQTDLQNALDTKLALSSWYATTTNGLAEGVTNKYYTDARVDNRINATTSIGTLTSAPSLSLVSTSLSGFLKATAGALTTALVDLTSNVTGILPVGNGGTGANTLTGLLQGNGTSAQTAVGGSAGQFPYFNGANTLGATSSIFLATNGNVGVGTTSPSSILDIAGPQPKVFVYDTTTGSGGFRLPAYADFNSYSGDLLVGKEGGIGGNLMSSDTGHAGILDVTDANPLQFGTNNTTRVTIDSSGNVGIGTTSPYAKFSIQANAGETNTTLFSIASSTASTNTTMFSVSNTGVSTFGDTSGAGDASMQLGNDTNAWSVGYKSSDKSFNIASSTNLTGTAALSIAKNGTVTIVGPSVTCVLGNGTSATNCSSSDERLKTNITALGTQDGLAAIQSLNPVIFNWNAWMQSNGASATIQFGFIAQDTEHVFPNLVSQDVNTGYYKLDYQGFIAPIVESIQQIASISDGFKDSLVAWLGNTSNGIVKVFASLVEGNTLRADQQLCVGTTCVTPAQFQAMVAAAGQSSSAPASSASNATSTPPVLQIAGDNPAIIHVGNAYADLGATITAPDADKNLGILTYLNGVQQSQIVIDTSQVATDTIDYVVTDALGNTATSTRTVIIQ